MSHTTIARHPAHTHHPIEAAFAALGRLRQRLAAWNARRQANAQLLTLDDHELKDIGLSRGQALFEHDKPFWRV
jgi:uncharacterized protein YjiS (DUF1127 family)